ncbi:MAG: tRNA (N(6)-L-threonylcarbamoyladenosine(37)-C(2))-methylthiotransferase MtaB [Lentisphaeria bacterium]|nr:tRNA (N(6)-L-threonylcarbamoyladenosine(37)-C(2))-methylthiotransferase MtaB [Lentisphaeria bacterium]
MKAGNAAIFTLGCRLNQADGALLADRLRHKAWNIVDPAGSEDKQLIIINGCSVTGSAAQKSRQAARKFRRQYPDALIIVTGCSAESDYDSLSADEAVDLVLTNPEKRDLSEMIEQALSKHPKLTTKFSINENPELLFQERSEGLFNFRSRPFVKIQEGCNNFCTYCIVPYTRGPERSRSFEEIIHECKAHIANGSSEIVLTGVNVCAYNDHGRGLEDLLGVLVALPGNFRLRLSSTEPVMSNLALLDVMATSGGRICEFLHISLQHGADSVLGRMKRRYTSEEFRQFVEHARKLMPGIHIGTDVIVGFPGESDEEFKTSCDFIESIGFANIHIFTYSPREGTAAAVMPNQVKKHLAAERYAKLSEIAAAGKLKYRQGFVKSEFDVIFERVDSNDVAHGWSGNYLACAVPEWSKSGAALNRLVRVQALAVGDKDETLFCRLL